MKITIDLIVNEGDENNVIEYFRRAYEDCPDTIHMFSARKENVRF